MIGYYTGLWQRTVSAIFDNSITAEVKRRVALAVRALDDPTDRMIRGRSDTEGWRDRYGYDRDSVLRESLKAWRENPIARRIVGLTTQYVVGKGLTVECKHEGTNAFIKQWWNHRLNHMPIRMMEWCDELTRTGNLIPIITTGPDGMTFVRAVTAMDLDDVITADNDVEQPLRFIGKQDPLKSEPPIYEAYNEADDDGISRRALHYAVNRPVGAKWGEPDLAPLLKWLTRYAQWLEDRVRLNHFRQMFLFIVRGIFPDAAAKQARQNELNAEPPTPGSVLVTDQSEAWGVLHPQLDSFEAQQDGLAVKKMIATGSGNPLHFLGEPESSTRTTAESAGGPTYRYYEQRQFFFVFVILDITRIVVARRARIDPTVDPKAEILVRGADISARDNAALANAASTLIYALIEYYDRGLIDAEELIRLAYTFAGELVDVQELLKKVVPPRVQPNGSGSKRPPTKTNIKIDKETGDVKDTTPQ